MTPMSLEELADDIPDGSLLAIPKDEGGVAMAATRALIRRGARHLNLLCVPTSGLQADMLIGAGCVDSLECGAVTLDEEGLAPRFRAAIETGAIQIVDSTCPAIYAALQAAEKGSPFASLRGVIGSDVANHRKDWKIIDNPFSETSDPVLLVPAIRPDIALFHARLADRQGNVWVGNKREVIIMAHAAKRTFVTFEEWYDGDLAADARYAAGTIAALYINGLSHAANGAWPLAFAQYYRADAKHLSAYAAAARTEEGFTHYLAQHVFLQAAAVE
mgnify:CR=1 FL=1